MQANACHHIVAKGARKAAQARDKLRKLGIDVDDAANGVALPKKFHQGMHTDKYYEAVNDASDNWKTTQDAVEGLRDIANSLGKQAGGR